MGKKASPTDKRHHNPGRPPIPIDLDELEKVCMLRPTDEELAAFFNVSTDTLLLHKKNDPEFLRRYQRGREMGKVSLRRKQYALAMDGNATMLIWLGKNELGQTDKQHVVTEEKSLTWLDKDELDE